ncbi:MAG: ABC transporter substrate-binding protein, partial [Pseudomonadota bacterium]
MKLLSNLLAAFAGASTIFLAPLALAEEHVNVYSARHYDTDLNLYSTFTKQTGVEVRLIEGGSDALMERIANEAEFTPADLLITVDAGRLWRAKTRGLLQAVDSEVLNSRIPSHLRDSEGHWFGLSKRARIIVSNKNKPLPFDITRYEDLADSRLKSLICMRSSSNIYNLSLLSALIEMRGTGAAQQWAQQVVNNFARKPQGNDTSNLAA